MLLAEVTIQGDTVRSFLIVHVQQLSRLNPLSKEESGRGLREGSPGYCS